MSFSPLDNHEDGSPIPNLPRVTMCLDKEFQDEEFKEDATKSENMKVYARVRPMLQKEEDEGYRDCITLLDDNTVRAIVPANSQRVKHSGLNPQDVFDFKYTEAFGPDIGQYVFFRETIMDTMLGYIEGQNCLIFNYGITNSGKTYTLQGNEANPGIIPLAMHLFFGCIDSQLMDEICVKPEKFSDIVVLNDSERAKECRLKAELLRMVDQESFNKTSGSDVSVVGKASKSFSQILCECFRDDFKYQTDTTLAPDEMEAAQSALYMREMGKKSVDEQPGKCNIWVSFIEIYNEYIYDLLQPNINQRQKLSLAEDQNGDVYVKGAREVCVSNSMEAIKLMHVGRKNLRIASTKLNYQSSRSHCIFTVKIARVFDDEEHGTSGRVNRICFCDLAGSERANKSQTSGMRLKEAGYINTSLMVLGRCLDQLRRNQTAKDKKMIPFRESKLTRLFSNHFLGKGKAVMIANASPCEYTFDETLNVLRFSALAKDLTISDSYMSTAQSSILDICNQWQKSKNRLSGVSPNESYDLDSSFAEEIEKRDEMIEKLVDVAESLRKNLEQEKREKIELEFKLRQEIGDEYSEHGDQLLDEQKKIFERQIESLRDIYKKNFEAMKERYEKKIRDLEEEHADDLESDQSFENSINEINKTIDKAEESLISFSPAVGQVSKQEVPKPEENVLDTSMDFFDTVEEHAKTDSDFQSLKEDLESVSNELSATKQKLEQTLSSLKESETERAIANEKSDSLSGKLLEANQVLEEYQKELEQLKATCKSCENEIDLLLEDKKFLQDNVLSLSDQLSEKENEAEQFKKERLDIEESYSHELAEKERKIAELEEKCKELNSKLEEAVQAMTEATVKYDKLKEENDNYKNSTSSIAEDFSHLKEKFTTISLQLAETVNEAEQVKKEKLEMEEDYSQKLAACEKKILDLEEECQDLNCKLEKSAQSMEELKTKYNNLGEEYENHKNSTNSTAEDYCVLKEKYSSLTDELELVSAEIPLLKTEKINLETSFSAEKTKLLEEITRLEEKCKELSLELESTTRAVTEEKSKYDELVDEYDSYKKTIIAEIANKDDGNEKLAAISKELDATILQIESLKKEKLDMEEGFAKEKEDILRENNDVTEQCKNLRSSLESSIQDLEDKKVVIHELEMKMESLESTYTSCKTDYSELQNKLDHLEKNLTSASEELDATILQNEKLRKEKLDMEERFTKEKEDMLRENSEMSCEKCKELNFELEKIASEEKLKVEELVSKCSTYESENARLLENLKTVEEKLELQSNSNISEECENLDKSLEENSEAGELGLKIKELESSCAAYKTKAESASKQSEELLLELEKIAEIQKEEKSKTDALLSTNAALQEENAKLSLDIKTHEEKTGEYISKIEELSLKLNEINQLLADKELKIEEFEKECSNLKNENVDLLKTLETEREKYDKLSEEQAGAIKEIQHLQEKIAEAVNVDSEALSELKINEAAAQEKCRELILKLEESSKIIEDQKVKIGETEESSFKEQNLELSEKCASLKEEYSSFSEIYGKLVHVLEKCELIATDKIKLLHSSSIKNLEALADLNRQVREKETSIDELERALCDCQKQLKESEAKAKKQVNAIKQQHTIEVEELAHLKKLVEEENLQLKTTVAEMERKNAKEEIKEEEEAPKRSSSNASKGKKKRSLSEVSKDEADKSQDKENSDRETLKEKVVEEKAVTKRRRVLRQKQETVVTTGSNSESEEECSKPSFQRRESDGDYMPVKTSKGKAPSKGRSRQAQKKTVAEVPAVTTTRTSRRKLQDATENASPVKKVMTFMGSTLRSVAQTVSNMPSPRITRGRRKLFNADAPVDKKWKL